MRFAPLISKQLFGPKTAVAYAIANVEEVGFRLGDDLRHQLSRYCTVFRSGDSLERWTRDQIASLLFSAVVALSAIISGVFSEIIRARTASGRMWSHHNASSVLFAPGRQYAGARKN